MKNFIDQVRGSIYDPKFYTQLKHKETSYTIVYLIKLSAIIGLLASVFVIISLFTLQKEVLRTAQVNDVGSLVTKYVEVYFPSDLEISLSDSSIKTNKDEPVEFPVPYEWFGLEASQDPYFLKDFAVISPREDFTPDLFTKYDSYIIVSSSSAAIFDPSKDSIKTMDLTNVPASMQDRTLDKIEASKIAAELRDYVNQFIIFVYPLLAILVLIGATFFIIIGVLIFSLWITILAWIIGKLAKSNLTFGEYYLRSIHADTLYIVLSWTIGSIITLGVIPFLHTIMTIFVLYFNENFNKHE